MIVLAILIALAILNKALYKSYFNPIFLQSVLWLVYYFFLAQNISFFNVGIEPLNKFVLLQSIGFSLGGFICLLFTRKTTVATTTNTDDKKFELTQKNIALFYPIMMAVLLFALLGVFKQNGSASFLKIADLRSNLTEDDGKNYGLWGLLHSIVLVYVIVVIASKIKITNSYKILIFLFFYLTLMLGGKGPLLFFMGGAMYILLWQKRIKKIYLVYGLVSLMGLMALLTNLRFGNSDASLNDNDVLTGVLLTYAVASVPGLEISTLPPAKTFGYYTFRIPYLWINKLGFDYPIDNVLAEFTNTPLPTNTYSYLKPYYYDFGFVGVFIVPLFLGLVHTLFYFKAKQGSLIALIVSALLLFPLLTQILEEQYFRWMTNWVYFYIIVFILCSINFSLSLKTSTNPKICESK